MADLFDYLHWRGDLTFAQAPLTEVDSVILCRFSYLPLDGIVGETHEKPITIAEVASAFFKTAPDGTVTHPDRVRLPEDVRLLTMMAASKRFADVPVSGYVNVLDYDLQKQFSAVTLWLDAENAYVSFRGTDNTLVGWKENLNMCFLTPVPAQEAAAAYVSALHDASGCGLMLGGHSKGGNLAMYAAAFCQEVAQAKITGVDNCDGPGFEAEVLEQAAYQRIQPRIRTFIPQGSIVGMLLNHGEPPTVVSSNTKGVHQHNIYSWDVDATAFARAEALSRDSILLDKTIKDWISDIDRAHRAQFIDALYEVLAAANVETLHELDSEWYHHGGAMLKKLNAMDEPTQELIKKTAAALYQAIKKNVFTH